MSYATIIKDNFKQLATFVVVVFASVLGLIIYFSYFYPERENQFDSVKLLWGLIEIGAPVTDKSKIIIQTQTELNKKHKIELETKDKTIKSLVTQKDELQKKLSFQKQLTHEAEKKVENLNEFSLKQKAQLKGLKNDIHVLNRKIDNLLYKQANQDKVADFIEETNNNINKSYVPKNSYTTYLVKEMKWNHDSCEFGFNVVLRYGENNVESCSFTIESRGVPEARTLREGAKVKLDFANIVNTSQSPRQEPYGWCEDFNKTKSEIHAQGELDFVMKDAKSAVQLQEKVSSLAKHLPSVCQ